MDELLKITLLVLSLLNVLLAVSIFRYYKSTGAISYGAFLIAISIYTFSYAFEVSAPSLEQKIFWLRFESIGFAFLPTTMIIFGAQYVENKLLTKPLILIVLVLISSGTVFFTFEYPDLTFMYKRFYMDTTGPFPILHSDKGFWYWIHHVLGISSSIIFLTLFSPLINLKDKIKRHQAILMLSAASLTWVCYILYLTGQTPHNFDIIPFSFIGMAVVSGYTMFKYKLFDFKPIALENVFNNMNDIVLIIDDKNRISNYNKEAKSFIPELSNKSIGRTIDAGFNDFPEEVRNLINADESDITLTLKRHVKEEHYHAHVTAVKDRNQQTIGKIVILRDITEQEYTRQKLIENQNWLETNNKTQKKLLSIISHDLRGSLGSLFNLSSLLDSDFNNFPDETKKKMIQLLVNTSSNSLKLTENILMWAKSQMEGFSFTPVNIRLNQLVSEVVEFYKIQAPNKTLQFVNCIPDSSLLKGDENMVKLILRNLISNAVKYSNPYGTIEISIDELPDHIIIHVQDSGIGIPKEILDNLFTYEKSIKRFGTDNEGGSGLGLILCKEFVEKHNGKIWVESEENQGSCFSVSFPKILEVN